MKEVTTEHRDWRECAIHTARVTKPDVVSGIGEHEGKTVLLAQHPGAGRIEQAVLEIDDLLGSAGRRRARTAVGDALDLQNVAISGGDGVVLRGIAIGRDQLSDCARCERACNRRCATVARGVGIRRKGARGERQQDQQRRGVHKCGK